MDWNYWGFYSGRNLDSVTKREGIETYTNILGFTPELLDGLSVCDFGCGSSNIHNDLSNSTVFGIDVVRRPGYTGSNFIENTPENLANIPNDSFDITLLSFASYQFNQKTREQQYREILRTTKIAVHVAPVYGTAEKFDDWGIWKKILLEEGQHKFQICLLERMTLKQYPRIENLGNYLWHTENTQSCLPALISHLESTINPQPSVKIDERSLRQVIDSSNTYQLVLVNVEYLKGIGVEVQKAW